MNMQLVRPNKGLPLTLLVVGEGQSISGEPMWFVKELGFRETFAALKSETYPLELSPFMAEQVKGWLQRIGFNP